MGVTVLDVSEKRLPSLRQALLRDIGYIVSDGLLIGYMAYLLIGGRYVAGAERHGFAGALFDGASSLWFLLEVLSMLTNQKRRALHDWVAGTVVVCEDPPAPIPALEPILVVNHRTGKPDLCA